MPIPGSAQRGRAEAQEAESRATLLGEASVIFMCSIEHEGTLQSAMSLAVPVRADWCVFDVVERSGRIRRVTSP